MTAGGKPERLAAKPEFFIHAHALTAVSRQVTAWCRWCRSN